MAAVLVFLVMPDFLSPFAYDFQIILRSVSQSLVDSDKAASPSIHFFRDHL
jgi:hypothetical protein